METQGAGEGFSFAGWLRTGRLIRTDARWGAREVKFNPNHDPKDGRFTFAEGGGSAHMSRPPKVPASLAGREDPRIVAADRARKARDWGIDIQNPKNQETYTIRKGDTLTKIAAMRTGLSPGDLEWLNGLSDDQIVAGQTVKVPSQASIDASRQAVAEGLGYTMYVANHGRLPPLGERPTIEGETFGPGTHVETRNGYAYTIDPAGNPRKIDGTITRGDDQGRDRKVQAAAGLPDRLPTDQGGHYIARRFNGPRDAFNHFAQDQNFNKSGYAKLEKEWDRLDREGKRVHVTILPEYIGTSRRPYRLRISYTVGGETRKMVLDNRSSK